MSSKRKRKRSCPFSSAKKAPKRKSSKVFNKEWAEALTASDKGSYFEQDKLLELDGLDDEEDEVVPAFSASRLKLEGKREEDPQETEAEGSDSEESESQGFEGSWQKLNYRTVVSGPSLQENLGKSVSCRFCHADVPIRGRFRKHQALLRLRSEKLLQYSFGLFADARPIFRPIFHALR